MSQLYWHRGTAGQGATNAELTAFQSAFSSVGGSAVLGCATGSVGPTTGNTGYVQQFENGHIHMKSGSATAYASYGPVDEYFVEMGGTASWLGFPASGVYSTAQGTAAQDFENGSIFIDLAGAINTISNANPTLVRKSATDTRVYYVADNGVKSYISDPETFEILGLDWNSISLDSTITTGLPELPALRTGNAKDGSLIRRTTGVTYKVYLIENGIARHVPDPDTLFAMGRRFDQVSTLDDKLFDRIPKGAEIPSINDGSSADMSFIDFISGLGAENAAYGPGGVNLLNGNYTQSQTDLVVPGRGLPVVFKRTYNAMDSYSGPLGPGWTHSYNVQATEVRKASAGGASENVFMRIKWGDGHEEFYNWDSAGSSYKGYAGVYNAIAGAGGASTFTVTTKALVKYAFELFNSKPDSSQDKFGNPTSITTNFYRLKSVSDRNGNNITLIYAPDGTLSSITDTVGRTFSFAYTQARLSTVTDPIGRMIFFAYDADGKLTSSTDPNNGVTSYTYKVEPIIGMPTPLIETVKDPNGNPRVTNSYNIGALSNTDYKKVSQVRTGGGNVLTDITYTGATTNITLQEGPSIIAQSYTRGAYNRLIEITDPVFQGATAAADYLDTTNPKCPTVVKDNRNNNSYLSYDNRCNALTLTDANDGVESFQYDAMNNVTKKTDSLGRVTTYTYDAKGNLVVVTTPIGTATVAYDASESVNDFETPAVRI